MEVFSFVLIVYFSGVILNLIIYYYAYEKGITLLNLLASLFSWVTLLSVLLSNTLMYLIDNCDKPIFKCKGK